MVYEYRFASSVFGMDKAITFFSEYSAPLKHLYNQKRNIKNIAMS
jgi:hypothetical protein